MAFEVSYDDRKIIVLGGRVFARGLPVDIPKTEMTHVPDGMKHFVFIGYDAKVAFRSIPPIPVSDVFPDEAAIPLATFETNKFGQSKDTLKQKQPQYVIPMSPNDLKEAIKAALRELKQEENKP